MTGEPHLRSFRPKPIAMSSERHRELVACGEDPPLGRYERRDDDGSPVARLRSRLLFGDRALDSIVPPAPPVEELLDVDTVAAVFGPWGSYKSFYVGDLACCVATASDFHGRRVQQGKVLYVQAEGLGRLRPQVEAWKDARSIAAVSDVVWLPQAVNLYSTEETLIFCEVASSVGPSVVVWDTLARNIVGADENSARDMGRVVENIDLVRRATGACQLLVHHTGKNTESGLRGSSVLGGALDTVLRLDGADGYLTVTVEKQKYRADGEVLPYRLRPHLESLVIESHNGLLDPRNLPRGADEMLLALDDLDMGAGVSATAWQSGTTTSRRTFFRHAKRLHSLGLSANVGTEKQPRWSLTGPGREAIKCHGANEVRPGAMTPGVPGGATVPPPLWGGTVAPTPRTRSVDGRE